MARNFRLYDRILVAQLSTGSILDLSPTEVRQDLGRSFRENTQTMDDGSAWRRSQQNSIAVPLLENDQVSLARAMIRQNCPCIAIGLGLENTKHLGFFEEARLRLNPEDEGSVAMAADTLIIETSARYPDIADSNDLWDPIPFRDTDDTRLDSIVRLGTEVTGFSGNPDDATTISQDPVDIYTIQEGDLQVYRPYSGSNGPLTTLPGNPTGIASQAFSLLYIANSEPGSTGTSIVEIEPDGSNETESAYHDQSVDIGDITYNNISGDLHVIEESNDQVAVVDAATPGTLIRTYASDASNPPTAIANSDGDIYVFRSDGTVEVYDSDGSSETLLETYSLGSPPDATTFLRGTLWAYYSGETGFRRYRAHAMTKNDLWRGRYWLSPGPISLSRDLTSISLTGTSTDVTEGSPLIVNTILPAWGATVEVSFAGGQGDGEILARDWVGETLASTDAGGLTSSMNLTLPTKTWYVEMRLEDIDGAVPELRVTDTAPATGAQPGQSVSDCGTRASSPSWV